MIARRFRSLQSQRVNLRTVETFPVGMLPLGGYAEPESAPEKESNQRKESNQVSTREDANCEAWIEWSPVQRNIWGFESGRLTVSYGNGFGVTGR